MVTTLWQVEEYMYSGHIRAPCHTLDCVASKSPFFATVNTGPQLWQCVTGCVGMLCQGTCVHVRRCALPCVAGIVYFVPEIPCTVYMYMCGVTGKTPMPLCGSAGRASAQYAGCHGFESHLRQLIQVQLPSFVLSLSLIDHVCIQYT